MALELTYNVMVVSLGTALLCGIAAYIGNYAVLRKQGLIGDVIAHSVLPGIALAFLITGNKNPVVLLLGAIVTGWLATISIEAITNYTKIKSDAAIALVLSVFFGGGIVVLTYIQHLGLPNQSGLESYLFGQAAAIGIQQVQFFGVLSVIIFGIGYLLSRGFTLISFDEDYAKSIGMPVKWLKLILSILTVATVAMGVQAVGVVLMAALLITPAAGARFFTSSLQKMMFISIFFGVISGVGGALFSAMKTGLSTGPIIVVNLTFLAAVAILFGTDKGIVRKWLKRRKNERKILEDHILKDLYHYCKKQDSNEVSLGAFSKFSHMPSHELKPGLKQLVKKDFVTEGNPFQVTQEGMIACREIVRKHRLWELYLSTYFHLDPDHVHDDAEGVEHLITPEIEAHLSKLLDHPERDPHNEIIPYE